jgi:Tfp pilus assembly protein PilN
VTRVNLLRNGPVHRQKAEPSPDRHRGALACLVILALTSCGLGWWGLALHRDAARVTRELVRARHEVARLRTVAADAGALEAAARDIQERIEVLLQLRAAQGAPVRILEEIGRAVPEDCWLTAVIDEGSGGSRIDGRAPALSSLFQLVERLEGSSVFRSVDVLDSRATPDDSGTDLIAFSLIASLHAPHPGAGEPGVRAPTNAVANDASPIERSR